MDRYDYVNEVFKDLKDYVRRGVYMNNAAGHVELLGDIATGRFYERVNDAAWASDSVTGNASGSYHCNAWKAKECVMSTDDDYVHKMVAEFGVDMSEHWGDWEYLDVSLRCYALGEAVARLEEWYKTAESEAIEVVASYGEEWALSHLTGDAWDDAESLALLEDEDEDEDEDETEDEE